MRGSGIPRVLQRGLDAIAAPVVVLAPDGTIVFWNRACAALTGYAREEATGRTLSQLVVEPAGAPLEDLLTAPSADGAAVQQSTWRLKSGALCQVSLSCAPLEGDDERALWIGVVRTEREAREAKADLERAQAVARVGSWRLDVERSELWWSDETHRIFGSEAGTPMSYDAFLARVHPEDRAKVARAWSRALRGEPYDIEHRILVGDETRWVRERAELELDEQGRAHGIGVVLDISDQKEVEQRLKRDTAERLRAEDALRVSEQRLRVALSASPVVVWNQDRALRYTWIHNPRAPFAAEQVLGKTDLELLPRADAEHLRQIKQRVLDSGEGARTVVRTTIPPEVADYDLVVEPLRDREGRVVGVSCASWDITAQKRREDQQTFLAELSAALMQATPSYDELLRALARIGVRGLADWVFIDVIEEERVRRVKVEAASARQAAISAAFESVPLDRRRPHLAFEPLTTGRSLLLPDVSASYLESLAQSEEHLELLRALDASSLMAVPLLVGERRLGAFVFISSREQRRYDESDLQLAEEVARLAALAVDNALLYRQTQRALAARDQVLGVVAHDLRSPLFTVMLQAERLLREGSAQGNGGGQPAALIQRAVRRMTRLIEDMLDTARLEARALSLRIAPHDPGGLLQETLETQRDAAARNGLELRAELPVGLPPVLVDRDRVLRVLDNLVSNAIKFTPSGGAIELGADAEEDAVRFWVRDTGRGIAEEQLPRLFDRFWQASPGDERGAGLGLPIVKGLVEAHGGRVWVESRVGMGTTICFTLPRAPPTAREPRPHSPPGSLERGA